MGTKKRPSLPRSVRRHIRREKGRIRRTVAAPEDRSRRITELYGKFGITAK